jgi:hypothetical protein
MRDILSIIFLVAFINLIYAQDKDVKEIYTDFTTAINSALLTKKGANEISGFLSYNYLKTEYDYNDSRTEQIMQFEPGFSYFYFDNISFGLILSYLYQKTDYESSNDSRSMDQIFIGPMAKVYFSKEKFRPFLLTDYLFLTGDNFEGGEFDIGAGVLYHVTGNFGINLQVKYGFIWSDKNHIDNQNRIFIGVGFSNFIL